MELRAFQSRRFRDSTEVCISTCKSNVLVRLVGAKLSAFHAIPLVGRRMLRYPCVCGRAAARLFRLARMIAAVSTVNSSRNFLD